MDVPLWEYQVMGMGIQINILQPEILPVGIKRGEQMFSWYQIIHIEARERYVEIYTAEGIHKWHIPNLTTETLLRIVKKARSHIQDPATKAQKLASVYETLSKRLPHDAVVEILKLC